MLIAIKRFLERLRAASPTDARPAVIGDRVTVRRAPRWRHGYISWPARPALPPQLCRIEDLSFHGARIAIDGAAPDDVWVAGARLYLTGSDHEQPCRLAWQKGAKFGLRFEGRPLPLSQTYP